MWVPYKLVSDAFRPAAYPATNAHLVIRKAPTPSICALFRHCEYIQPNTAFLELEAIRKSRIFESHGWPGIAVLHNSYTWRCINF